MFNEDCNFSNDFQNSVTATAQKMKLSIKSLFSKCMSMVNVTKFAVSSRFGHIYWRNF